MGAFGRFFKKVWGGIKKGARTAGRFVTKIAKPVINVAKKALPFLSLAPGVVGNVARAASGGLALADKAINQLPDSKLKSKLQDVSGAAGKQLAQTHEKAADLAERAKTIGEQGQQVINAGKTFMNGVKPAVLACKSQGWAKNMIQKKLSQGGPPSARLGGPQFRIPTPQMM